MTNEQLRIIRSARPFSPFEMHLADGRFLSVPHPEFLAFSPPARTAIVFFPDGGFEVVDLLLVTALRVPASEIPRTATSQ